MNSIKKKKVNKIGEYEYDEKTKSLYIRKSKMPLIIGGTISLFLIIVILCKVSINNDLNKDEGAEEANLASSTTKEVEKEYVYKTTDLMDIEKEDDELLVSNELFSIKKNTGNDESKEYVEYSFVSSEFELSDEDMKALIRIVEAEATDEDIIGKILIANVIFNRVRSSQFPNTVTEVVFQKIGDKAQFSPIDDGRYYSVPISRTTEKAVDRALKGEDYSKGALFFAARRLASSNAMSWFDAKLTKVLKHGSHEFYKY